MQGQARMVSRPSAVQPCRELDVLTCLSIPILYHDGLGKDALAGQKAHNFWSGVSGHGRDS